MKLRLAENLMIDLETPLLNVEFFRMVWKPNEHAYLELMGYISKDADYKKEQLYSNMVKVWLEEKTGEEYLFNGHVTYVEIKTEPKIRSIVLKAKSGSYLLDQKLIKRSFQDVSKTYAEVVRHCINDEGGEVICTIGSDQQIGRPVIQYKETPWDFSKRLASHLGSFVIPDIVTGKPNIWFGMKKGDETPIFFEQEYTINLHSSYTAGINEISYIIESKDYYKLGDRTTFRGQTYTIYQVIAIYENGELIFKYLLKQCEAVQRIYQSKFAGLGLEGTVQDVYKERVNIALDIDGGNLTGNYFYDWYPETGNALYAMPEKGARVILCFDGSDEQFGFVLHCLPNAIDGKRYYADRCLDIEDGNSIQIYKNHIQFSQGKDNLLLRDDDISINTKSNLKILAEGKIKLKAKRITLNTPEELNIYQG